MHIFSIEPIPFLCRIPRFRYGILSPVSLCSARYRQVEGAQRWFTAQISFQFGWIVGVGSADVGKGAGVFLNSSSFRIASRRNSSTAFEYVCSNPPAWP